jgi:hypothetical protein
MTDKLKREETEIEKAQRIVTEAEQKKQKEFGEKLTLLLDEYGYILDVVSQITLKKK